MDYITLDQLKAEVSESVLLQLADDGTGNIDTDLLDDINRNAVGEVEGYLRGIYVLPLVSPIDPIVEKIVAGLMYSSLYRRTAAVEYLDLMTETQAVAVGKLKDISRRIIKLDHPLVGDDDNTSNSFRSITPDAKFQFPSSFSKW